MNLNFGSNTHTAVQRAAKRVGVDAPPSNFDDPEQIDDQVLTEQRRVLRAVYRGLADDESGEAAQAATTVEARLDSVEDELKTRETGDSRRPIPPDGEDRGGVRRGDIEYGLTREQRFADHPEVRAQHEQEYAGLGLGRYLRAMTLGAKSDIEKRALSEGSDSAGGFTVPQVLSSDLIDRLRALNVATMAGARTIPITSDQHHIAKVATDPTTVWHAENAEETASDATFARVAFEPKTLLVLVRASRELIQDSLNIEQELPNVIAAAMAGEVDRVVFRGTGTNDEPEGLDTLTDVQVIDHADASLTDHTLFTQARRMLLDENAREVGPWVMPPKLEEVVGNLTDTTNQPLRHPPVLDPFRILTSSQLPTNLGGSSPGDSGRIYVGGWQHLVIGLRNEVRVEVLRERFASSYQVGFLAAMRCDVAAVHPKALLRIEGVSTS